MAPKFQWFPFYTADFWNDESVQLMTYAQVGMYLKIMSLDWDEGSIPDDWSLVARLLKIKTEERDSYDEMVEWVKDKYDNLEHHRQSHRKMIEIRDHQKAVHTKRIEAARLGGQAADRKRRQAAKQIVFLTEEHEEQRVDVHKGCQNYTDPDPELEKEEEKNKRGPQPSAETTGKQPTIWFADFGVLEWTTEFEDKLQKDYPAIKVRGELIKARNWNVARPPSGRKKHALRFVTNWLNRVKRFETFSKPPTSRHGTATRNNEANLERQRRLDEEKGNNRKRLQPGVELPGSGLPGGQ